MSSIKSSSTVVTGKVYRFATLQELVDRVPGDRIRDCMDEIGTILGSAKQTAELMYLVLQNLSGKESGQPERIINIPAEFEWTDDGKQELKALLQTTDNESLMMIKIVPNTSITSL